MKKKVHFMGVGGAGCSAVFAMAHSFGFEVSGCDKDRWTPNLEKKFRGKILTGHDPQHLARVDLLVYSPAIPIFDPDNSEFVYAQKKRIESMPWEEFVAREFLKDKVVIAVAGTHGKGTTSAMIATILERTGKDPTALIGAKLASWKRNYRVGKSKYFVIEADEFKERFLAYHPDIAVITNIEFDHPECFKDLNQVEEAFIKFSRNMKPGSILVNGPGVEIENPNGRTAYVREPVDYELKMVGMFNKFNAALAAAVARQLLIGEKEIRQSLESFSGLERRFEFKGEEKGVIVFDDYAHHPTAIFETAKAAREKFPNRRIWLVFQPHLYSRTKVLFDDFVKSFEKSPVDKIVLLDIFAAREKNNLGISSIDLVKAVKNKQVSYLPTIEEASTYLTNQVMAGDVVISMGAGDVYKTTDQLLRKLGNKR